MLQQLNRGINAQMDRRHVQVYERIKRSHSAESATSINLCENPFQEIELVADTAL